MGNLLEVTDATFAQEVEQSDVPVLVDFWAAWCGPCKALNPILENIAEEMGEKVKIVKLDVDNNRVVSEKYGIMNLPTMLVFNGGEPVKKLVGLSPKKRIVDSFEGLVTA